MQPFLEIGDALADGVEFDHEGIGGVRNSREF
jgi:hypothetical protein